MVEYPRFLKDIQGLIHEDVPSTNGLYIFHWTWEDESWYKERPTTYRNGSSWLQLFFVSCVRFHAVQGMCFLWLDCIPLNYKSQLIRYEFQVVQLLADLDRKSAWQLLSDVVV